MTTGLAYVDLGKRDRSLLASLADQLAADAIGAPETLSALTALATQELPSWLVSLRQAVAASPPSSSGWLVRGLPIDEGRLGPTPESWRVRTATPTAVECQLLLIGSALGFVFAWGDQQGGAPVHNIVPVVGEENSLLSSSSTAELSLHTEDAYFSDRADLLLLLALRNPCLAPTYVADVRNVAMTDAHASLVRCDRYLLRPDGSHGQAGPRYPTWGFPVIRPGSRPTSRPSALIGGPESNPWLRFDIDYVDAQGDEAAWSGALALNDALHRARTEVVLHPGDLLIIDNVRCAHGRGGFTSSFDGADRWIKRISVATRGRFGRPQR
jgi:L-asparagine oxygenase